MAGQDNLHIAREMFAAWNAHDVEAFVKRLDTKTTWELDAFPSEDRARITVRLEVEPNPTPGPCRARRRLLALAPMENEVWVLYCAKSNWRPAVGCTGAMTRLDWRRLAVARRMPERLS